MTLKFIEDVDLSPSCIKEPATPNANNNVMWTTNIVESPDSKKPPTGQMSSFMRVIYVITPGKEKTAKTHPSGNRNCDVIVENEDVKFIQQCNVLDNMACEHAIKYKDYYWEGEELTDKQVRKRHRKLLVPTKDGDKLIFRCKLRPMVRKNKKGELVPNKRGTVMIRVDENDEEADEPTPIDEVHCNSESIDSVQNILQFVCFYRSDAYFGINPYVPQGWHKTEQHASFQRLKKAPSKKRKASSSDGSVSKKQHVDQDTVQAAVQADNIEDEYEDDDYE